MRILDALDAALRPEDMNVPGWHFHGLRGEPRCWAVAVLPALKISVTDAAKELGISRQTLHRLLVGTIGVSAEMALRLGQWCGNGPEIWLRMQVAFDLWHAQQAMVDALAEIPSHQAA